MKRSTAIAILAEFHIPFVPMVDGQAAVEGTRRMGTDDLLAVEGPRFGGEILVQSTDPTIIDALVARGFTAGVRMPTIAYASLRGYAPEDEAGVRPEPARVASQGLLALKSGEGFTGEPSDRLVDIRESARRYQARCALPLVAGGGRENARWALLRAIREYLEAVPGATRGRVETQGRLIANAILVHDQPPFEGYRAGEIFRA